MQNLSKLSIKISEGQRIHTLKALVTVQKKLPFLKELTC